MNECPACGEVLDLSGDDRGSRRSYSGASIIMCEMGRDVQFVAHCRYCETKLRMWARVEDGTIKTS